MHLLCFLGITMQFRANPLNCIMANFKFAKEYLCRYVWAVISVCHCRDYYCCVCMCVCNEKRFEHYKVYMFSTDVCMEEMYLATKRLTRT